MCGCIDQSDWFVDEDAPSKDSRQDEDEPDMATLMRCQGLTPRNWVRPLAGWYLMGESNFTVFGGGGGGRHHEGVNTYRYPIHRPESDTQAVQREYWTSIFVTHKFISLKR